MNRYEKWYNMTYDDLKRLSTGLFILDFFNKDNQIIAKNVYDYYIKYSGYSTIKSRLIIYYAVGNMILNSKSALSAVELEKYESYLKQDKNFDNEILLYSSIRRRVESRVSMMNSNASEIKKNGFENLLPFFKELNNYSDDYVASKIKLTLDNYKKIENNPLLMTVTDIFRLCDLYKISPNELLSFKTYLLPKMIEDNKKGD